ncbi:MAG TPA: PP2C family protein-serine/threonine phosphatase [Candidatus Nanopelagicales bacterium]|nr:PP2C family protein-serine/threonine phosphatase [Candidatus Nanopelagicales bacterium]
MVAGASLRTRVALLVGAGAVALALVAVVVWSAFSSARDVGTDVTTSLSPAAGSASDLVVAYDQLDRESRTYILTGSAASRLGTEAARARAADDQNAVERDLAGHPVLLASAGRVDDTATAWLDQVVDPALALRDQRPLTPEEIGAFLDRTSAAYADVARATDDLDSQVSAARDAATDQLGVLARRLAAALLVSGLLLAALLLGAYLLLRRWVLRPLDALRLQLRDVAQDGHRERVIEASGPPELHAVGVDAEAMRRALVHEQDAARAADQGLAQESPVVSALRADLATEPAPQAARLDVFGRIRPAHGVLAGDWWGVVPLEGDRTALVLIDVSGHGELAGLVAQRLRSVLIVALRSGFEPGVVLERGATSFLDAADGRFATALVAVLDPATGTLDWANAGHAGGWVLRGADPRTTLEPTGPLLSTLGGHWATRSTALGLDDLLLTWSDGLIEGRDADVTDAGLASELEGLVRGWLPADDAPAAPPAREVVEGLLAALREDSAEWGRDDITLVAARRTS